MGTERVLTVSRSSECLCVPVKSSTGLKYNSVAVSSAIICLGTNTGSTYLFEKESLKLVKFVSSKGESIEILKFSKDGKLLAIVDSGGTVTCLEIDGEKYNVKIVKEIEDHKNCKITCLCWDDESARLFIGDERGFVTAVIVAPFKLPAGMLFSKSSVEIVAKGESPIIQLDYAKLKLLVSTTTRTLLCLTDKSKFQQVGSKTRDGKFGSCYLKYADGELPCIYCARPGSRLWEVDFNGQVLATHQFKYLFAVPPKIIVGVRPSMLSSSDETWDKPQALAFPKLLPLCKRYLITWSNLGMYILDPSLGKISGWYDELKGIKDITCFKESLYILFDDGKVLELEFMTVKNCLKTLISTFEFSQAATVALQAKDEILNHVESFLTIDFDLIYEKLKDIEDSSIKELCESLQDLITNLQSKHDQIRAEIQERLNRMPSLDDSLTPNDSGVEDNDDVRSNPSEVISETSSRLSLSRLPQIDVDSVLRRATSAVVNKIVSTGFMKKALHDVLDSDNPHSGSIRDKRSPLVSRKSVDSQQGPDLDSLRFGHTRATKSPLLLRRSFDSIDKEAEPFPIKQLHNSVDSKPAENLVSDKDMGNVELRAAGPVDGFSLPKRQNSLNTKRRRKAKIVTVDFESPQKDDVYKAPTYEGYRGRLLSYDATNAYSPIVDIKRLASVPYKVNELDSHFISQSNTQVPVDNIDASSQHSTIIEKAKQLVRKVIHPEVPAPLDVKSGELAGVNENNFMKNIDRFNCLLVPEEAFRSIPKFVYVTAVCRNKLRDPRVLFNSKTVRKILQDWVERLYETVEDFAIAMADNIKTKNKKHSFTQRETDILLMRTREEFFRNLGAAFSEISNLAVLCFEAGIFPVSCSNLSYLEVSLIEGENTHASIRQKVNELLNKDDSKDIAIEDKENAVPQESGSSPLLVDHEEDGSHSTGKSFFICDEDLKTDSGVLDSNLNGSKDIVNGKHPTGSVIPAENEENKGQDMQSNNLQMNLVQHEETNRERTLEKKQTVNRADNMTSTPGKREIVENGALSSPNGKSLNENATQFFNSRMNETSAENCIDSSVNVTSTPIKDTGAPKSPNGKTLNENATRFLESKKTSLTTNNQVKETRGSRGQMIRLTSSTLREYVEIPTPQKRTFLQENEESILCSSDDPKNCRNCAEDFCRACFVLRYFHLLDLHKIRTVLTWKQGCRWRTWLAFLIHLEDRIFSQELQNAMKNNDDGKIARILRSSSSVEQFYSCLRRLLPLSSSLIFDICTEKEIYPWEVSLIYMSNAQHRGSVDHFLSYISTIKRIKPASNPIDDVTVAMTALYCSLKNGCNSNKIKEYLCECNAARKGAHLLLWERQDLIDEIIALMLKEQDSMSGLIERALALCLRYGYWSGCIEIYRHRKQHKSAFEILNQLGDFSLLNEYVKAESFSIQEDELRYLCSLIYHSIDDSGECKPAIPGFATTITNESLARLLVRELGCKEALKVLKSFKEEDFLLPTEFYYDCMKISEREMDQRLITVKIMEKLSNETCNENRSILEGHIEQLKNKELSGNMDALNGSSTDSLDSSGDDNEGSSTSSHWGVNLSLSSANCPCCTLPLCIHGSSASAGLIVFECGHTYHKQCMPEEACLLCYYDLEFEP